MNKIGTGPPRGKSHLWKWSLGVVILLGLGAWGIWGRRPPPPAPPQPAPAARGHARMESLALTEIQEGDKRWVLEAKKADFHKERHEVSISGVRVEFFGSPGKHLLVQGDEGLLNTKTRVLTLRGKVEVKADDLSVKTRIITYHPKERVLLAPEEVVLETPRLRVQGKGLRLELAEKKLVLAQHQLTQIKGKVWEGAP